MVFRLTFALLAALVIVGSAPAQADQSCNPPDVFLRLGEVAYIDHNAEDPSVGDQRVLTNYLFDAEGNPAGTVRAVSTVVESPEDDPHTVYGGGIYEFDDGTLQWHNTQTLADASDTSRSTDEEIIETVVSGGTGAYRNARGILVVHKQDDGWKVAFDIACDRP